MGWKSYDARAQGLDFQLEKSKPLGPSPMFWLLVLIRNMRPMMMRMVRAMNMEARSSAFVVVRFSTHPWKPGPFLGLF